MAAGRGDAATEEPEARGVLGMILDVFHHHLEAVELGRQRRADGGDARRPHEAAGSFGGGVGGDDGDSGEVAGQEHAALGCRLGLAPDLFDIGQRGGRWSQEVVVDGDLDLAADTERRVLEGQRVEGGRDRALDGVLHGHDAGVDLPFGDGGDDAHDVAHGHDLGGGQVGLAEQSLLGEGALGPQECDAHGGAMIWAMDDEAVRQLLDDVRAGRLDPDDAIARLRTSVLRIIGQ